MGNTSGLSYMYVTPLKFVLCPFRFLKMKELRIAAFEQSTVIIGQIYQAIFYKIDKNNTPKTRNSDNFAVKNSGKGPLGHQISTLPSGERGGAKLNPRSRDLM